MAIYILAITGYKWEYIYIYTYAICYFCTYNWYFGAIAIIVLGFFKRLFIWFSITNFQDLLKMAHRNSGFT